VPERPALTEAVEALTVRELLEVLKRLPPEAHDVLVAFWEDSRPVLPACAPDSRVSDRWNSRDSGSNPCEHCGGRHRRFPRIVIPQSFTWSESQHCRKLGHSLARFR
jgi:hypothetical protein